MFSKILAVLFFVFVLCSAPQAFSMCFNVNLPVSGIITEEENCSQKPELTSLDNNNCYLGTINFNPPFDIEVITTTVINSGTNALVRHTSGNVLIENKNGAQIFGSIDSVINTANGKSTELMLLNGGTGNFSNVTGQLIVEADYDFINGTYTSSMKGEICLN